MKNIKIFIPICATAFCACSNVNDKICEDNSGDEGGVIAKSINTLLSLKESSAYNEVLDEQIDNFKCFKKEIDWHKWRFLFKQKKFLEGFDAIDENIEGCSNGAKRFLFIHSFLNIFHDDALLYFAETSGSLLEKIIFRSKKQLLKFKFLFDLDFGDPVTNQDRREVIQFLCDLIDSYPDQKDIQKKKEKLLNVLIKDSKLKLRVFLFTFFCENFKKFFDSLDAWLPLDDQFFFKEKSIIKSSWLVMMSDGSIIKIPDDQFSAFLGKIYRCDLIWPGGPGSSPTNKYREAHEEINFCVIPSCVLNIPARYFYRSWNLFGISIPEGVSSIGEEAFSHCHLLWKINLPSSLSVIEKRTFMHCASLDNLTLHGGITTIKDEAFYNCSLVEGIKFPRSLTTIGNRAFFDCYLDSIEIPPKQFKFIGEDAFTCRGVRTVTIYDCDVSFEYPIFRSLSNFVLFVPEPFFNDIITGDLESFKTFLKKLGFEDYTLEFLPIGFPMPNFDDFVRHENHFIEFRDYSNLFANKVYDHDLVRTPFFYEEGAVVEF